MPGKAEQQSCGNDNSCLLSVIQVKDGRLYAATSNSQDWAVKAAEDLLSVAVYLYDIPDTDFLLHL